MTCPCQHLRWSSTAGEWNCSRHPGSIRFNLHHGEFYASSFCIGQLLICYDMSWQLGGVNLGNDANVTSTFPYYGQFSQVLATFLCTKGLPSADPQRFGLLSFANDQLDECLTRVWTAESLLLEDAPWVGQKMLLGMVYLIAGASGPQQRYGKVCITNFLKKRARMICIRYYKVIWSIIIILNQTDAQSCRT